MPNKHDLDSIPVSNGIAKVGDKVKYLKDPTYPECKPSIISCIPNKWEIWCLDGKGEAQYFELVKNNS